MDRINLIKRRLKQAKIRMTPQREAILATIMVKTGQHLSAEEIFQETKEECSEIGLATVYRTLRLLVDLHLINKISFENDEIRYDLCDEDHYHSHLHCLQCGKIIEVTEDMLDDVEAKIKTKFNFTVSDHYLTFDGICASCGETNNGSD